MTLSRFFLGLFSLLFFTIAICKNLQFESLFSPSFKASDSEGIFFILSFVFFLLSVSSDYLDGYLARRWGCQSKFGSLFDPLADKLLVSGFLILFASGGKIHWLIPTLSLSREIIAETIRFQLKKKDFCLSAIKSAKYKTALQFAGVFLGFFLHNVWGRELLNLFFLGSLLLSFFSLARYLKIYWEKG